MVDENIDGFETETLAETENYMAWRSVEPDSEVTFHLELGRVTLHFFEDEWQEFMALAHGLMQDSK